MSHSDRRRRGFTGSSNTTLDKSTSSEAQSPWGPYCGPVRKASKALWFPTPTARPRQWPSRYSISADHWEWFIPQRLKP